MDFRSFSSSSLTSSEKSLRQASTSLKDAARASSAFSYQDLKNLAALAVDLMAPGLDSAKPRKGDFFGDLKGDMGDGTYNDLCADEGLTLVKISYCQIQLPQLENFELGKKNLMEASGKPDLTDANVHEAKEVLKWGVVNHDFLVLELQPGKPKHSKFYVLAEKLWNGSNGKAGIFINYKLAKEIQIWHTDKTVSYSIDCGKQISLQDLLKNLKCCDPDYCLRDLNCWDYAIRTVKKLLLDFAEDSRTSEEEKERLLDERKSLEANLFKKSMRNFWEKVKDYTSKRAVAISRGFAS